MKDYSAGNYINQGSYKSFQPTKIDREWIINDMHLLDLLSEADRQIGRLDMYSECVPNIDLFVRMHVVKEATQSSKIEGTETGIEEALQEKKDFATIKKRNDWEEVQDYMSALQYAIDRLAHLPLSTRLLKETHKLLLRGVRGKHKLPGEFRRSQNWIGGASVQDAVFVPPLHNRVDEYMEDLENFLHNDSIYFPALLKIALIHYQFETIHPFLDGNGRLGRLFIILFLIEKRILKKPVLYLSDFLEQNRTLYYDNLMLVRQKSDINQWFKFFLVGVIATAKSSIRTFDAILKLQKEVDAKIQTLGSRAASARAVVYHLYKQPLIDTNGVEEVTGLSLPTVYKLIRELEQLGILINTTASKRKKTYAFQQYIDLFKR